MIKTGTTAWRFVRTSPGDAKVLQPHKRQTPHRLQQPNAEPLRQQRAALASARNGYDDDRIND